MKEISEKQIEDFYKKLQNPDTKLSEEDLQSLKKKVMESISIDLQKLIVKQSFCAQMILRFDIIPSRDYRIRTACTNGDKIYFDIDFYKHLTTDERLFVLAHEVWHNILLHFARKYDRDSNIWNLATDCEINYMLSQEGFIAPSNLCFPTKEYEGKNAEEIYEKLSKKNDKQIQEYLKDGSKNSKSSNNGSGDNRLSGQFDKHCDKNSGDEGEDGESSSGISLPKDEWGEVGIDKDVSFKVASDAADKIREMVINEAQKYERQKGNLPGNLAQYINSLIKPEISWEELLTKHVTSCFGDKRVWLPPQRRHVWHEMYFQSRKNERINIACIIDTSGSTAGDLPKFITELVSIVETFGNYSLVLIQNDAKVQSVDIYNETNPFPVDDLKNFTINGGGGSDLRPAFDKLVEMSDYEFSDCVVFTDGYIDWPDSNPLNCKTLAVLTEDGEESPEWCESIKFKSRQ